MNSILCVSPSRMVGLLLLLGEGISTSSSSRDYSNEITSPTTSPPPSVFPSRSCGYVSCIHDDSSHDLILITHSKRASMALVVMATILLSSFMLCTSMRFGMIQVSLLSVEGGYRPLAL